ncbi:histidinol-phosphate transaminase [Paenibacillus alvei]|uniref:Histidinol-phosphate aminotransferase n=1 Tax=Paenibacillus alvei TaxID=44250 RepID=A0ABT4GTD4_PAEAL|nr:histidinol-phosphate transaminase [Paenibacillus alvei]EJW18153.1 histidinol-phosphate aminotransferase HisC [Paenibacillus alvei DSM 29]MCY7487290.1 histidinol-phosphate transaminase [Paenibacillus alvei]MCY9544032.1 histidinol-phosphate transaminase [Paenibacillus alvei]MCY9703644.1 histidinol-phosphate transaminase [Paenibacillus alvei]MCY9732525.1 histidinol-phosphate transaminase [Paenibacillus alvei]
MQPKNSVVHLPVYQPGKSVDEVKRELGLDRIIKLASNENPFGSSKQAKQAILQEVNNMSIYPDGAAQALTDAVAAHLDVERKQLIFGAGSDEIILMICRAYLVPGDEIVIADQTFPQYKHNAEIEGAVTIEVPLKDGAHDLDAMLAAVNDRTKIVWICNPNNPTGTIVSADELDQFIARIPAHVMVVLDEAYCEYVTDPNFRDALELVRRYSNVVSLRTFSKIYGLASLRIGYGIGHPDVIHTINQVREPFNTTRFAQAAALAAVQDQAFIEDCRQKNAAGIQYVQQQFARMNLDSFPAHGNFIMVDVGFSAIEVFNALLRRGIITRAGHSKYPQHIRITIGSQEENEAMVQALEEALEEVKVTK